MGQFGDKFRKAREAKELTLDDVSNVTKIGPRMLQAIEEENFERLPGGVFNKGFIRAYAKHLGLDPEEAITEYLDCLRQAQVVAQQAWDPAAQTEVRPAPPVKMPKEGPKTPAPAPGRVAPSAPVTSVAASVDNPATKAQPAVEVAELPELQLLREADVRPPARTTYTPTAKTGSSWRLIVVAGLIFILGIALWTRRSHTANPQPAAVNPAPTNSSSSSPVTPPPIVAPAQSPSAASSAMAPDANSAGLLQSPPMSPQPSRSNAPTTTAPAPATSPGTPSSGSPSIPDTVEDKNDVTIRTFGKAAPAKTTEAAAASFSLVIRATENSWLSVVADGQQVRQETLIAPAHTSVHATREIVVKVGNAAAISFLFNGKEISPQGNEAEAKTLVFDSSGLKTTP
jgi:cytoskeletal protein RodZ